MEVRHDVALEPKLGEDPLGVHCVQVSQKRKIWAILRAAIFVNCRRMSRWTSYHIRSRVIQPDELNICKKRKEILQRWSRFITAYQLHHIILFFSLCAENITAQTKITLCTHVSADMCRIMKRRTWAVRSHDRTLSRSLETSPSLTTGVWSGMLGQICDILAVGAISVNDTISTHHLDAAESTFTRDYAPLHCTLFSEWCFLTS